MKQLIFALPLIVLGCGPSVQDDVVVDGPVVENTSGLEERLPDTCMLSNYEGFVGQSLAATLIPQDVTTRIIQPGQIVSQVYVADRVNFYVDGAGTITRVICG